MGIVRMGRAYIGNGVKTGFYGQTEFFKLFVFYFLLYKFVSIFPSSCQESIN